LSRASFDLNDGPRHSQNTTNYDKTPRRVRGDWIGRLCRRRRSDLFLRQVSSDIAGAGASAGISDRHRGQLRSQSSDHIPPLLGAASVGIRSLRPRRHDGPGRQLFGLFALRLFCAARRRRRYPRDPAAICRRGKRRCAVSDLLWFSIFRLSLSCGPSRVGSGGRAAAGSEKNGAGALRRLIERHPETSRPPLRQVRGRSLGALTRVWGAAINPYAPGQGRSSHCRSS
jgi:hypothetical protein